MYLLPFVNKLPLPSNCTCCAGNRVVCNSISTWGDNGETAKYPGRKVFINCVTYFSPSEIWGRREAGAGREVRRRGLQKSSKIQFAKCTTEKLFPFSFFFSFLL